MNLFSLRSYTASLLERAVKEIFPQASLVGSEISEIGFTVEFICPHPLLPETLSLFEEKMRGWVKEPPAFRLQEMIPSNAARLFVDKDEPLLADLLEDLVEESQEELVSVVCLDTFATLAHLPIAPFEKYAFKLIDIKESEGRVSVFGTAFSDKELVKEFAKRLKSYEAREWKKSGPEGRFLVVSKEGEPLFLPRGIEVQKFLKELFFDRLPAEVLQVLTPASWERSLTESHLEVWQSLSLAQKNGAKGGIAEWSGEGGTLHQFFDRQEVEGAMRSSLQFIIETSKILGFEYHGILCGISPSRQVSARGVNAKEIKALWREGVELLKRALTAAGIPFEEDEGPHSGSASDCGPTLSLRCYDDLGRSFESAGLTIDCRTSAVLKDKVVLKTEVFPAVDSLTLKLIEKYLQNTIKELGRQLESQQRNPGA